MSKKSFSQLVSCCGLGLVAALALPGCTAHAELEPAAYVETTYVPAHVHTYPSYYHDGRTVYLIEGRWYYRQPSGSWVYYRNEPPVLYRQRITIQQAPPARVRRAPAPPRLGPARPPPPARFRDDDRKAPPSNKKRRYDDRDDREERDDRDHGDRRHDRDHHDGDHDRY